jgi:predicted aspartyl protease
MPVEADFPLRPFDFDVLVTDIHESDLIEISETLAEVASGSFPVHGIIYGNLQRVFVTLHVRKRDRIVAAPFLVDIGAPYTFLTPDTLARLGYEQSTPTSAIVTLQGMDHATVYVSHGHFANINILGQDTMMTFGLNLAIGYRSRRVVIDRE